MAKYRCEAVTPIGRVLGTEVIGNYLFDSVDLVCMAHAWNDTYIHARMSMQISNSLSHNSPVYSGGQTQSQVERSCVPPFIQFFGTQSERMKEEWRQ